MKTALPVNVNTFVSQAAGYLEHPSYLTTIAGYVGKPVEWFFIGVDRVSPIKATDLVDYMLKGIMKGALANVPKEVLDLEFWNAYEKSLRDGRWHMTTTAFTGGIGGIFGLPALAVELPITTGVMFRSIACTARNFGKDLNDPETFLDCISVFSYGGGASADDSMDSTYLTVRAGMAAEMRLASQFLTRQSGEAFAQQIAKGNCPTVIAFMARVAAQFNVTLTPKIAAAVLPGISVGTGALINAAFTQHFNRVAEYHFGLQKLAETFGQDLVYEEYRQASQRSRLAAAKTRSASRGIGSARP